MLREFLIKNEQETSKLAKILAACLAEVLIESRRRRKIALVIGLEGELGSGKTTFIKAFAKGLGIRHKITSPTFVLMKKYKPCRKPKVSVQGKNLYHIDCYRIKNPKDILDLDFQEILSNPKNIIIIEWAEKIKQILPRDTLWLKFKILNQKQRRVIISN